LDFGCGSGAFARLMAGRGYDVVGLEPFSLGEPVHENGLRLVRGSLDDLGEPSQRFDAITLWQVLEHLADPAAQLAALAVRLEPRGVLLVSVPNFASWQRRLFGAAWFHLDPPRHLTHFDSVTLRALLLRMGFEPIAERTFHLEYGPVGWLQSALNLVLPHENVLHEFVKDRGELAHLTARQRALALAASLVAAATLAGPSVLAELAAGLGHAGAVVTIAARRLGS
jgi:SAM-dependent methyltransferase